jgi:hypothetical protein
MIIIENHLEISIFLSCLSINTKVKSFFTILKPQFKVLQFESFLKVLKKLCETSTEKSLNIKPLK